MNAISTAQMRAEITRMESSELAVSFSILFWTCNRKQKTGGDGIELSDCLLMKNQRGKQSPKFSPKPLSDHHKKDPQNHVNNTFNIIHEPSQNIFKVRYDLVTKFQGKQVVPYIAHE